MLWRFMRKTNHIHLLATPEQDDSTGKVFQSAGRKYVQYFNYTYRCSGTSWEGRYRATAVESERYLLTLIRYIELNSVHAGMVPHPAEYVWSSHACDAQGAAGPNADWLTLRVSLISCSCLGLISSKRITKGCAR